MLKIIGDVNPKSYNVGVIVARFQVHNLHEGQKELMKLVIGNHEKTIVFLGVPVIENTNKNPLNFETRKAMVMNNFPEVLVLPLKDKRSNEDWSTLLDETLEKFWGKCTPLLYGSRDSFIPYYSGINQTVEIETDILFSGTEVRKNVANEILETSDFRAGVIYATATKRDTTYPTVDIVAMNADGQILLCKKPNETRLRFIGGFVDRTDTSFAEAAEREFNEETGGKVHGLIYVTSQKVDDWRYRNERDGIMTTLFLGTTFEGPLSPQDDIAELVWVKVSDIEDVESCIMEEHQTLMTTFINFCKIRDLVKN